MLNVIGNFGCALWYCLKIVQKEHSLSTSVQALDLGQQATGRLGPFLNGHIFLAVTCIFGDHHSTFQHQA